MSSVLSRLKQADRIITGDLANDAIRELEACEIEKDDLAKVVEEMRGEVSAANGQRDRWREQAESAQTELRHANRLLDHYKGLLERAGIRS